MVGKRRGRTVWPELWRGDVLDAVWERTLRHSSTRIVSALRGFGRWTAVALPVVLLPLRWIGCSRDLQLQCLGILVALKTPMKINPILSFLVRENLHVLNAFDPVKRNEGFHLERGERDWSDTNSILNFLTSFVKTVYPNLNLTDSFGEDDVVRLGQFVFGGLASFKLCLKVFILERRERD